MSAESSYPPAGQPRPADTPGAAEPAGPGARQRRPAAKGVRLAQAACGAGLAYAAVSVYWALGGTWLLDTVGGTLEQHLWDPWFLLWGALVAAALARSRQPGAARIARGR